MTFTEQSQVADALDIPFSEQQLKAICAPLAPGVVIAGAGSGKTAVMAARVVWLVGTGQVRADQVLGLTFTRKAAAELGGRVRAALTKAGVLGQGEAADAGEPLVSTYDSFASRLVSEHGIRLGLEGDQRMITGAARHRIAERVVATADGPFPGLSRLAPDTITTRVMRLDGELASHLVDPEALDAHHLEFTRAVDESPRNRLNNVYKDLSDAADRARERLELVGLVGSYRQLKQHLGLVEYADQMSVAANLAAAIPEVGALLRDQFRVVLLDEYQDTSSAQALLLHSLFGGGHPVTAVGDPHQAIYGWRGAAASNILTFAETFAQADGRPANLYSLTTNRRSGQLILDAANRISVPLRGVVGAEGVDVDAELEAAPGTAPGDIVSASFDTWPDEVAWVADRIIALRDSAKVASWGDIAVLCRRNAEIGEIHAALTDRGVPAEIAGLGGLLSVPEVADVVATCKVIADPSANAALIRLLTGPRWRLGPADMEALGRRAAQLVGQPHDRTRADAEDPMASLLADYEADDSVSLAEALDNPGEGPYTYEGSSRIRRLSDELRMLRTHAHEPVENLVHRVVATLGLEVELRLRGPAGMIQLDAFLSAVGDYTAVDGDGSLVGLLEYLDAEQRHDVGLERASESAEDAVRLLTVHRAKGLEWPVVFLPALVEGIFPNDRVSDNWLRAAESLPADLRGDAGAIPQLADVTESAAKQYAEALKYQARQSEHRLAYVAVTRAKRQLVATSHAWAGTLKNPRKASVYLEAIQPRDARELAQPVSETNPLPTGEVRHDWPELPDPELLARRREVAAAVELARTSPQRSVGREADTVGPDSVPLVAAWDAAADSLIAEARRVRSNVVEVSLPRYLSTTAVMALNKDPGAWAEAIARPMPRRPVRATRVGEQFHAWLERRFEAAVSPELDFETSLDQTPDDEDLHSLIAAFERGPFADSTPVTAEVPFSLVLAGQVVRGRIDAVFDHDGQVMVVDWKTGRRAPDPLQLAVYRLAWAELSGVPESDVAASFYDVLSAKLTTLADLPGRAELEQLVIGLAGLG